MRILIVEDDNNKRIQLEQVILPILPGALLRSARSLQSAIRVVRTETLDIVVLDMTLPNFDLGPDETGGSTHAFGGRELLSQMQRFNVVTPVIVVTQFESFGVGSESMSLEQLNLQLQANYPTIYKGAVYYHASLESWKQQLAELVLSQKDPA